MEEAEKMREKLVRARALNAKLRDLRGEGIPYCPHTPHKRQLDFLRLDCLEALFGGAAGGGKSDCLLMCALQYVRVPQYAALILRKSYQDLMLPDAIMARAIQWMTLHKDVRWKSSEKKMIFPSGAIIQFGYLDKEEDKYRYQSSAFQFIGFDELTQFAESQYTYLFSRLRKPAGMNVPLRIRGATNPGGLGGKWVKNRFIDNGKVFSHGMEISAEDAVFVQSLLRDNPYVDEDGYRKSLSKLDKVTRLQLEDGNWLIEGSTKIYSINAERNVIPKVDSSFDNYILGLDFGFNDSTAFAILGWSTRSKVVTVVRTFEVPGETPSQIAERISMLERQYKFNRIVGDMSGLGKGYAEEARARYSIPISPAEKHNKRGYISLFAGELLDGHVKIFDGPSNELMLEQVSQLVWNADRTDLALHQDDHIHDAVLYAWRECRAYSEEGTPVKPRQLNLKDPADQEIFRNILRARELEEEILAEEEFKRGISIEKEQEEAYLEDRIRDVIGDSYDY